MMIAIALAQMNPTVGDIEGNQELIEDAIRQAHSAGAEVVAVPELAVTGYPPEDLLMKKSLVQANIDALHAIASTTPDVLAIVGFVDRGKGTLYNAAAVCSHGEVLGVYRKHLLPNYGVFDEHRYFEPGRGHILIETQEAVIGVCVCEDAWSPTGPVVRQGDAGAQIVVNINASPFHKNKLAERAELLGDRARRAKASIVYVNAVGGQDELVFDGGSLVVDPTGEVVARLSQFEETFAVVDVPVGVAGKTRHPSVRRVPFQLRSSSADAVADVAEPLDPPEEVYRALCLSLSDYARKNGFDKVVVGLSGGIDSSLTATIAADSLGPDNVLGVAMPSEFSSSHSIEDAKALAANLGIESLEIPIGPTLRVYLSALQDAFGKTEGGLAEENLQARIRGNLLMAISNRYGHLVIATGNKSEMACGYATLYGDMAGGFALLKDVLKTEVYELARYRNSISEVIPGNVLTKAPSAELRPGQKDSDALPPYEVLDPIIESYVELDQGVAEMVAAGHDEATVRKVVALVDRAEYKRRQAPPGPKVTTKAFGRDRRLPITNLWREALEEEMPDRVTGTNRPQ
jgi:NAD+ synthase (glutamine-hydrolysing)